MVLQPSVLLEQLDRALEGSAALEPLADERFLETHVLYEGRSDQQRRLVDWFREAVAGSLDPARPFRVLSVGCGSGILDVPVAADLAARAGSLDYVGIDPNAVECEAFARRFAAAELGPTATLAVEAIPFEDHSPCRPYDLVHIVHCLYYLPDAEAALQRAWAMLAPGGRLVVVHAPCGALNQLSSRFYDKGYGRPTWFAEDCASALDRWGWTYRRVRVDARVDVTPLWTGDEWVGHALRDFIVQFDHDGLPSDVQQLVERYLTAIATGAPGEPRYIAHPADVFVIDAP